MQRRFRAVGWRIQWTFVSFSSSKRCGKFSHSVYRCILYNIALRVNHYANSLLQNVIDIKSVRVVLSSPYRIHSEHVHNPQGCCLIAILRNAFTRRLDYSSTIIILIHLQAFRISSDIYSNSPANYVLVPIQRVRDRHILISLNDVTRSTRWLF